MSPTSHRIPRRSGRTLRGYLLAVLWVAVIQDALAACSTTVLPTYRINYSDKTAANAWLVKDITTNHCNSTVQNLKGDIHGNPRFIMDDIHYTLQRVPNHRLCLAAVVKYQARKGYPFYPEQVRFPTAECYLLNALQLFPKDYFVHSLMGVNQFTRRQYETAAKTFESVLEQQPNNAEVHYNLGLTYFAMKDYPRAAKSAEEAYRLGFPLPGLKRKLSQVGAWPKPAN